MNSDEVNASKPPSFAARQTHDALVEMHLPCLDYFMGHFLESFKLTLDELE